MLEIVIEETLYNPDIVIEDTTETTTIVIDEAGVVVVPISEDVDNRLERKPDGLYVRDRLDPNPVAYYLLSRG